MSRVMVEVDKSVTALEIREIFLNQQDNLSKSDGRKILMSHFGTFSQDFISSFSEATEELMASSADRKIVIKRTFSILIEGLQNIRLHGERDEMNRQLGFVIVANSNEDYRIIMANIINPEDLTKVEKYLDRINNYSPEDLKDTYLSVLENEFISQKGGAGLGFITTRMKSDNPLNYSFYALMDGKMLFTFDVLLNRQND